MRRRAAVAGLFYPGDATRLRATVQAMLNDAAARVAGGGAGEGGAGEGTEPRAFIGPHAGIVYSGPIMASACVPLAALRGRIRRVVMIGPAHRVWFEGIALSSADAFETPLGTVNVDREASETLAALPAVQEYDVAHEPEHSLEMHLPFLQEVFGHFDIVPLLTGDVDAADVARVLEQVWSGPDTLLAVSSDLSHFLSYDAAQRVDRQTADAIEALRPEDIGERQACGRLAIQGLLRLARERGLSARRLDLRNSGDTHPDMRDEVVGYGAWTFSPQSGGG